MLKRFIYQNIWIQAAGSVIQDAQNAPPGFVHTKQTCNKDSADTQKTQFVHRMLLKDSAETVIIPPESNGTPRSDGGNPWLLSDIEWIIDN